MDEKMISEITPYNNWQLVNLKIFFYNSDFPVCFYFPVNDFAELLITHIIELAHLKDFYFLILDLVLFLWRIGQPSKNTCKSDFII